MRSIPILYADDIASLITMRDAADAIRDALLGGLDPASDRARTAVEARAGQLLLMPSENATAVGVKAVTVAPANAAMGLPRVHGAYLLFDSATLELLGIMDGATLSSIRTPAVSLAAVAPALSRFSRPVQVTIFGAGPQAVGHADALGSGGLAEVGEIVYVVRQAERARRDLGPQTTVLGALDPAVEDRLRLSDVVVCTTTSATPLFASGSIADSAIVIVVGAHEATSREVDGALLARSMVVVEDRATAQREAGDVVIAMREGYLTVDDLVPMADVIRREVAPDPARPYVFKSVGMSWEDLVVAQEVMRRHAARSARSAGGGG